MSAKLLTEKNAFDSYIKENKIVVVHFFAPWAAQCTTIDDVVNELSKLADYNSVAFGKCEAEQLPEIALEYNITAVPTVLIFKNGKVSETINGVNAAEMTSKLNTLLSNSNIPSTNGIEQSLDDRLKALINKSSVMVFMKGNPEQPRCGFSKTLVALLNETKAPYETFDILQDEEVRQGLKTFSQWPTYPQVYVKGELVGGLDIIKELQQSGELLQILQSQ